MDGIVEGLVALIMLPVYLAMALFELSILLVEFFCQMLGISVSFLGTRPKDGGKRVTIKRLLIAALPLVLFVVLVAGAFLFYEWRRGIYLERVLMTENLVKKHGEILAMQVDEEGHFIKYEKERMDVSDPFGSRLQVEYEESLLSEVLIVRSAGGDHEFNTFDDIKSKHTVPRSKTDVAVDVFKGLKGFVQKRLEED